MIYIITNDPMLNINSFLEQDIKNATIEDCIEYFKEKSYINFDTETTGLLWYSSELLTIQLGTTEDQFVIDIVSVDIQEFKTLLEGNIPLIIHNAKFDLGFLYKDYIYPNIIIDTFLQERVLTTGIDIHKKSYEACISRYIDDYVELDKTIRLDLNKSSFSSIEFIRYCATDVEYGYEIHKKQLQLLTEQHLLKTAQLDNNFVLCLTYVEMSGFRLDIKRWMKKMACQYFELTDLKKILDQVIIDHNMTSYIDHILDDTGFKIETSLNWNSPMQVQHFMNNLGVYPVTLDTKTGETKPSVSALALREYANTHPEIDKYLNYKTAMKRFSSYGDNYIRLALSTEDGRVRTMFSQIKNTGRMSSGNAKLKLVNFQNIPAHGEERLCMIPNEGNIFIVSDYSQQEQVIMANKSQDPGLVKFFKSGGGDMHSFIAQKMFPKLTGLTLRQITEQFPELRQMAKAVGFAINYGGNEHTIAANLGWDIKRAENIVKAYYTAFPGIANYMKRQKQEAWNNGFIVINERTGRRVYFPNWESWKNAWDKMDWIVYKNEKKKQTKFFQDTLQPRVKQIAKIKAAIQKKSLNYPIQGSASEMTKLAGCMMWKWIRSNNYINKVLINNIVHDEFVLESPLNIAEKVKTQLELSMNATGAFICPIIPCKSEAIITKEWKH